MHGRRVFCGSEKVLTEPIVTMATMSSAYKDQTGGLGKMVGEDQQMRSAPGSSIINPWPRPGLPRSRYGRPDMEEQQKQGIIQSTSRQGGRQSSIFNPKGFTLIEVIIFIVVAGVIASAIFIPFLTGLKESMTPEKVATATYLAQYKMEFFTKNSYTDLNATLLTDYTPADISGYQWQWQISYVDKNLENEDFTTDTGYKLISVKVKDPDNREIELQTVVTKRPADE